MATRQPRGIRLGRRLPPEQRAVNNGVMTGPEFVQQALQLQQQQRELAQRQAALGREMGLVRNRPSPYAAGSLADLYRSAMEAPAGIQVTAAPNNGDFFQTRRDTGTEWDLPDIVIEGVHDLPQRQRPDLATPEPPSPQMMEQMDTGKYPTVEEHLRRTTPEQDCLGPFGWPTEESDATEPDHPAV